MYITAHDLRSMSRDFASVCRGPGGSLIRIEYMTVDVSEPVDADRVYKTTTATLLSSPISIETRGIIQVVSKEDLDILQFGIVKVGDRIFYLSTDIDLASPDPHFPLYEGTLVFIDPAGIRWKPIVNRSPGLTDSLIMLAGDSKFCLSVPCYLERDAAIRGKPAS
jgi:hypothetical protein